MISRYFSSKINPIKLGITKLIMKSRIDALKAVDAMSPIFPRKKTAALSRMPKSPMEIGSIVFTSITADNAKNVFAIWLGSKA